MMTKKQKIFSISQVNGYIRALMEDDVLLSDLFVQGEVSNFKAHSSGHLYFTLKDARASLNCVMFKSDAVLLQFEPENGMEVFVYGRISTYEKTGQYQLYAELMQPAGRGALYETFEKLKLKLGKKGYFDEERKKEIPANPQVVGVITSPTGAAVQDIIRIGARRNSAVEIVVIPALVQGEEAPESIAGAIAKANAWKKADVLIVGRGGGSMEDLWAFNEEVVAKAIYSSKIPIVSAVGHETDFTIADFTADMRASTPSAAAEICIPDQSVLKQDLQRIEQRLTKSFDHILGNAQRRYESAGTRLTGRNPLRQVYNHQIYLADLLKRLHRHMDRQMQAGVDKFGYAANMLENLSPLKVLARGYSITIKENFAVPSVQEVAVDDVVKIRLRDGSFSARVTDKTEEI